MVCLDHWLEHKHNQEFAYLWARTYVTLLAYGWSLSGIIKTWNGWEYYQMDIWAIKCCKVLSYVWDVCKFWMMWTSAIDVLYIIDEYQRSCPRKWSYALIGKPLRNLQYPVNVIFNLDAHLVSCRYRWYMDNWECTSHRPGLLLPIETLRRQHICYNWRIQECKRVPTSNLERTLTSRFESW